MYKLSDGFSVFRNLALPASLQPIIFLILAILVLDLFYRHLASTEIALLYNIMPVLNNVQESQFIDTGKFLFHTVTLEKSGYIVSERFGFYTVRLPAYAVITLFFATLSFYRFMYRLPIDLNDTVLAPLREAHKAISKADNPSDIGTNECPKTLLTKILTIVSALQVKEKNLNAARTELANSVELLSHSNADVVDIYFQSRQVMKDCLQSVLNDVITARSQLMDFDCTNHGHTLPMCTLTALEQRLTSKLDGLEAERSDVAALAASSGGVHRFFANSPASLIPLGLIFEYLMGIPFFSRHQDRIEFQLDEDIDRSGLVDLRQLTILIQSILQLLPVSVLRIDIYRAALENTGKLLFTVNGVRLSDGSLLNNHAERLLAPNVHSNQRRLMLLLHSIVGDDYRFEGPHTNDSYTLSGQYAFDLTSGKIASQTPTAVSTPQNHVAFVYGLDRSSKHSATDFHTAMLPLKLKSFVCSIEQAHTVFYPDSSFHIVLDLSGGACPVDDFVKLLKGLSTPPASLSIIIPHEHLMKDRHGICQLLYDDGLNARIISPAEHTVSGVLSYILERERDLIEVSGAD